METERVKGGIEVVGLTNEKTITGYPGQSKEVKKFEKRGDYT